MSRPALIVATLIGLAIVAEHTTARAEETNSNYNLTAGEIQHVTTASIADVRDCYQRSVKRHALTKRSGRAAVRGQVEIDFTVDRYGDVVPASIAIDASGVNKRRFNRCVRDVIAGWSFPAKRAATPVKVPYLFQHTATPGAGPRRGCPWKSGCKKWRSLRARDGERASDEQPSTDSSASTQKPQS